MKACGTGMAGVGRWRRGAAAQMIGEGPRRIWRGRRCDVAGGLRDKDMGDEENGGRTRDRTLDLSRVKASKALFWMSVRHITA